MCLLVQQYANTQFSDDFVTDVYNKNRDGIGVMYADGGRIIVHKYLPKSEADFLKFYRDNIDGRDCVWHARMQTHGDIDLANCHPYKVTDHIWMAHNGILSSGNDNDESKSDTWHFIHNVIEPVLTHDPDRLMRPEYQAFLGDLIGSTNKFGFMTSSGTAVIVNRAAGVTYQGAWLSNTYAWSATKFGVGRSLSPKYGTYGSGYSEYWGNGYYSWEKGYSYSKKDLASVEAIEDGEVGIETNQSIKPIVKAAYNSWLNNGLQSWVNSAPEKAVRLLAYCYDEEEQQIEELVWDDPLTAIEWVEELFSRDGLTPAQL